MSSPISGESNGLNRLGIPKQGLLKQAVGLARRSQQGDLEARQELLTLYLSSSSKGQWTEFLGEAVKTVLGDEGTAWFEAARKAAGVQDPILSGGARSEVSSLNPYGKAKVLREPTPTYRAVMDHIFQEGYHQPLPTMMVYGLEDVEGRTEFTRFDPRERGAGGRPSRAAPTFDPTNYQSVGDMQKEGWPFHFAVQMGDAELVELLVGDGGDVNQLDPHGSTVLHNAIKTQSPDRHLIETLIRSGARLDIQNAEGDSALDLMVQHTDIFHNRHEKPKFKPDFIIGQILPVMAELDQVARNKLMVKATDPAVQLFLVALGGAEIEAVDHLGRTALLIAVDKGDMETATALLQMGANIDSQDAQGNTLLHRAVEEGDPEFVESLLERDANPDILNAEGWTARDLILDLLQVIREEAQAVEADDSLSSKEKSKGLMDLGALALTWQGLLEDLD